MATNNATNTPQLTTNGQLFIGHTSNLPSVNTLTAGTGVTITNGAGTITIASSGASNVVDQNTSSVTCAVNTVYICDNGGSEITFTLPSTAALGDFVEIVGASAGGWTIVYGSGQSINFGALSTTTTSGNLTFVNRYDCVKIRCTTANTTFGVVSSIGNITVA